MNPDVSQAFNILRNLVPVKWKMVHSHNGYRMYDLENVRVGLDADENHDTVNLLDDKLTSFRKWSTISSRLRLPTC